MSTTFAEAMAKIGVPIPDHLVADAEVPVFSGPQTQGDLMIVPADMDTFDTSTCVTEPVPNSGVQVIRGEVTNNTHWLHRGFDSPGVGWAPVTNDALVLGVVMVPNGQTAELIHTDEHGANAMGPGCYVIRGKREMAEEIRRVAD